MKRYLTHTFGPILLGVGFCCSSLSGEILITEILYNAAGSDTGFEYVEIYNSGDETVDVTGWKLSDEDSNAGNWDLMSGTLDPGQVGIITLASEAEFKASWPTAADAVIFTSSDWGSIANTVEEPGNEEVSILNDIGELVDMADYLTVTPWPEGVNGSSIYLLPGAFDSMANDDGANWAASTVEVDGAINASAEGTWSIENIGSPGYVNNPPPVIPDVVITEIMYNAAGSDTGFEWVEIYNYGDEPVDVTGWKLSDEDSNAGNWDLMTGILEPGQVGIITQATEADFKASWPTAADAVIFTSSDWGSIANTVEEPGNETTSILDANGDLVDMADYLTIAPWPEGVNGSSIFLLPEAINNIDNDVGVNWAVSTVGVEGAINASTAGTFNPDNVASPGIVNDPALASRYIVITEIMYNAAGSDTGFEWVEIYNTGPFTIDVTGWKLSDEDSNAGDWELMTGSLGPGQAGIITQSSEADFKASWPTAADAVIFTTNGWGSIANTVEEPGNETTSILDAVGELVDMADYLTVAPWPEGVNGSSIMLKPGYISQTANDDGANWMASEAGVYAAVNALADGGYNVDNMGSPGTVVTTLPPPSGLPWEADGVVAGEMSVSPWFGAFTLSENDWIRHIESGWLYVGFVEQVGDMWMYSLIRGDWLYSNESVWPVVYDSASGDWIFIFSLPNQNTWIFNYTTQEWTQLS